VHRRPFVFVIPLKPRKACSNWEIVQDNLSRTIESIRGGSVEGCLIILAYHDRPDIIAISGCDLHLLQAPFAPETQVPSGAQDKARKLRLMGSWLRKHLDDEGAYVMFLDSDDLVHRELVRYVLRADDRRCYSVAKGYMYDCRTGVLELRDHHFFTLCGSSFIGWFCKEELPRSWKDMASTFGQFGVHPYQRGHQHYHEIATELGKKVETIPFPAVTYMVNHGDSLRAKELGMDLRELHPLHLIWPDHARTILSDDFSYSDAHTTAPKLVRIGTFASVMLGSSFRKIERRVSGGSRRQQPYPWRRPLAR